MSDYFWGNGGPPWVWYSPSNDRLGLVFSDFSWRTWRKDRAEVKFGQATCLADAQAALQDAYFEIASKSIFEPRKEEESPDTLPSLSLGDWSCDTATSDPFDMASPLGKLTVGKQSVPIKVTHVSFSPDLKFTVSFAKPIELGVVPDWVRDEFSVMSSFAYLSRRETHE